MMLGFDDELWLAHQQAPRAALAALPELAQRAPRWPVARVASQLRRALAAQLVWAEDRPGSWAAWRARYATQANDVARTWGAPADLVIATLHDASLPRSPLAAPPPFDAEAWQAPRVKLDDASVAALWTWVGETLAPPLRTVPLVRVSDGRARCLMIENQVRQISYVGGASYACWAALLHEIGHAVIASSGVWPAWYWPARSLDEASAEAVAGWLWSAGQAYLPAALAPGAALLAARARYQCWRYAQYLDLANDTPMPTTQVPWALWQEPGLEKVYLAAYARLSALPQTPGALWPWLSDQCARADRAACAWWLPSCGAT